MREIKITDFEHVQIGNVENQEAATGMTVFVFEEGACAGLDIRGGGPAARESQLLNPLMNATAIHAIVLGGGSAFGLDGAGGVMKYLEDHHIGYPVGPVSVPLVCQSDIFDLLVGDYRVRPDQKMGYQACENLGNYQDGNFGAGCGATIGKYADPSGCMKSGIGSYAVQIGELMVGAVVCVNAIGDVYNWKTGEKIAGYYSEGKLVDTESAFYAMLEAREEKMTTNTTIGVILTNAKFDKASLCKIASMGHDGMARAIRPIHTSNDGDSLYAVSLGDVEANRDVVGTLAAQCVAEAIMKAVESADSAYGLKCMKDLKEN